MDHTADALDNDELLALARRDAEAGRVEEALRKLKPLIAQAEGPIEALPLAARIYAQLQLAEKAQACYRRYLAARPEAVLESFELGMTHFEKGEAAEADRLWRAVLQRSPTHPPTLFYSAVHAARSGREPDARRHLDVLFQAVTGDNLYVQRGRELLKEMDAVRTGH
jgi:tetratricopeptide (TPR) repeat protein